MQGKTLTDVFIEKGLIKPIKCPNRLDESSARYTLDVEEEPQNEEKSQA